MQETWVQSLGWEDPLEKGKAIHSSMLAWRIPWMEEPGGLQSLKLPRVGFYWATSLSLGLSGGSDGKASAFNTGDLGLIPGSGRSPGEWSGNPLQYSCWTIPWMEEPGRLQSMGSQRVGHDWVTSLVQGFSRAVTLYNTEGYHLNKLCEEHGRPGRNGDWKARLTRHVTLGKECQLWVIVSLSVTWKRQHQPWRNLEKIEWNIEM